MKSVLFAVLVAPQLAFAQAPSDQEWCALHSTSSPQEFCRPLSTPHIDSLIPSPCSPPVSYPISDLTRPCGTALRMLTATER